jgi:hypothetical protein
MKEASIASGPFPVPRLAPISCHVRIQVLERREEYQVLERSEDQGVSSPSLFVTCRCPMRRVCHRGSPFIYYGALGRQKGHNTNICIRWHPVRHNY